MDFSASGSANPKPNECSHEAAALLAKSHNTFAGTDLFFMDFV